MHYRISRYIGFLGLGPIVPAYRVGVLKKNVKWLNLCVSVIFGIGISALLRRDVRALSKGVLRALDMIGVKKPYSVACGARRHCCRWAFIVIVVVQEEAS
jgi:hypothetical protein